MKKIALSILALVSLVSCEDNRADIENECREIIAQLEYIDNQLSNIDAAIASNTIRSFGNGVNGDLGGVINNVANGVELDQQREQLQRQQRALQSRLNVLMNKLQK